MSPTLLSKRLKELIDAGVITTTRTSQPGVVEYKLTDAGEDLRGIVMSLGVWGTAIDKSSLSLKKSRSIAVNVGHAPEPFNGIVSKS